MNLSRFDDFYYTICKETGGIEGLFHSLFNFLLRKTDFFYEMDPGDKMGFPPGVAPKMVIFNFHKKTINLWFLDHEHFFSISTGILQKVSEKKS